jgi:uncharacterized protein (DUF4415 family)
MSKRAVNPERPDPESPELTLKDMARLQPLSDVPDVARRWPGRRGPQKTPTKEQVTLRLDRDVVAYFRAKGRGWQTAINSALRRAIAAPRRRSRSAA